ncbi:TonB-dependent receptor [Niabella sp. CC-SYL272]|uniref:TonB-dependent receptor n=1 Tax=Niabella agricola TaxID=2891571 RepID=UPI001F3F4353|nr:TonB-dependent receptor [Niabella agricola]MCF3111251.1 TonB-dependent receptor [Niabella agricola]
MRKLSFKWIVLRLLVLCLCCSSQYIKAQNEQISIKNNKISLADVFKAIKAQTGLTVFYNNQQLNDKETVSVDFSKTPLRKVLAYILKDKSSLDWVINDRYIILRKKTTAALPATPTQPSLAVTAEGIVLDEEGNPVSGTTITIKGSGKAVSTDASGKFSIEVPGLPAVLMVNHVAYESVTVSYKGQPVTIRMVKKVSDLNDVVVIGYGASRKKDLTGAVGKANVEDMQKAPVPSFDQALAGRIAGVAVVPRDGQPGAASQIVIRGSSVTQDASPLFVVDGFPIENMDINSINPDDIASFEVLKDASSIAIYGARGANGVIMITTKRGKVGRTQVTYNYSIGVQRTRKQIPMMEPYEFVRLQLEMDSIRSTPASPVKSNHDLYLGQIDSLTGIRPRDLDYYRNVEGYNWQDLLLRDGISQKHAINITGGTDQLRYVVSGSYYDQQGVIINTGLKRYEGKFSLDHRINQHFRYGLSGGYSNSTGYGTIPAASFNGGVVQAMWQYRPVSGIGSEDLLNAVMDSLAIEDFLNGNASNLGNNVVNPLAQAQNEYRKNINGTGTVNAFLEYQFLKNFTFRISGGYNSTNATSEFFYNSSTQQGNLYRNIFGAIANTSGINGGINTQSNRNYLNENILTYRGKIGKDHTFNVVGGFTYQYARNDGNGYRTINIPQSAEYLGIKSVGAGTPNQVYSGGSLWQLYSWLGRINYTFKQRYLLTGTGRLDGSSKFAKGNQWGFFPSGAAAWRFSEEPFLKGSLLSDGKLRVSYGSVGNNKVGDFSYMTGLAGAGQFGYPFNNQYIRGSVPFFNGNPALTWETSTQLDLGLELGFFKDRIAFEADYYKRKTGNFLLLVDLPYLSGYSATAKPQQYQNTGVVFNEGLELTLNTINIRNKNFRWTSNFNISFNKSKIGSFYNGLDVIETGLNLPGGSSTTAWIAKVGESISQFYGYVWDGVYQYSDFNKQANGKYVLKNGIPTYSANVQPGDAKYKDINHDGVVSTSDQTVLGTPLPKHSGGFSNNLSYKSFSLNIFFQWSYGNQVLNANRMVFATTGGYFLNGNQYAEYANRWTPDNPTNEYPRALYNTRSDITNSPPKVTSRLIEDASFLRLKTVSFGYDLPRQLLKKMGFSALRVNLAAQNLLTLTSYSGVDPEVSTFRVQNAANAPFLSGGGTVSGGTGFTFIQPSSSYTALSGGLDYTAYPQAVTVTFGITATF